MEEEEKKKALKMKQVLAAKRMRDEMLQESKIKKDQEVARARYDE